MKKAIQILTLIFWVFSVIAMGLISVDKFTNILNRKELIYALEFNSGLHEELILLLDNLDNNE